MPTATVRKNYLLWILSINTYKEKALFSPKAKDFHETLFLRKDCKHFAITSNFLRSRIIRNSRNYSAPHRAATTSSISAKPRQSHRAFHKFPSLSFSPNAKLYSFWWKKKGRLGGWDRQNDSLIQRCSSPRSRPLFPLHFVGRQASTSGPLPQTFPPIPSLCRSRRETRTRKRPGRNLCFPLLSVVAFYRRLDRDWITC